MLFVCIGFHWKLIVPGGFTWLDSPDMAYMEAPRFQFQAMQWSAGRFPLWDPHHWCGQPFLGQMTSAAWPLNWALGFMPLQDGHVGMAFLHWYFILIHCLAALAAYALCRDLGCSHAAAAVGGLVFSLAAFLGTTNWPEVLNGAWPAPLVLLFLLRAARGERPVASAALSGFFLGLSWLSGHHEAPVYITAAAGAVWVALRKIRLGAIAALFTVLVSGLQTVPAFEFARLARRWAGANEPLGGNEPIPYTVHEQYSLSPISFLGTVIPGAHSHVDPYLGWVAMALATLGLVATWSRRDTRVLACCAAGAFLVALGGSNVFHGLMYAALPVFGKARVPARALVVWSLGAAPLVALGLDALRRGTAAVWLRPVAAVLAAGGAVTLAVQFVKPAQASELVLTSVTALLFAALLAARGRLREPLILGFTAVLLIADLGSFGARIFSNQWRTQPASPWAVLTGHRDVIAYLQRQPPPIRVYVDYDDVPANWGDWYGLDSLEGFTAAVTSNILDLEVHTPQSRNLLGVNFFVARKPPRPDLIDVFTGAGGLHVYRNPSALPRAWAVHEEFTVSSRSQVMRKLGDPAFVPSRTALTWSKADLQSCQGDRITIAAYSSDRVVLNCEMRCRGLVVLSDTWFPGWEAAVDGQPAEILEVYGALRGVVVNGGNHRMEMNYRPRSFRLGAAMTLAGALGTLALVLIRWPR